MGLFSRPSKPSPSEGDESRRRPSEYSADGVEPAPEPERAERPQPTYAEPPTAEPEEVSPPESDQDRIRVERVEERPESTPTEPDSTASEAGDRVGEGVGDSVGEDDDRLSAEQMLAPVRKRPPIGEPVTEVAEGERRSKVISFANQKGGVAKTTTTLNLAVAFAESGKDVLCVDLDPQGNLTMSQGIDPDKVEHSMYDVLVDRLPIREVIHRREIDIAVASIDLAGAEIAMSTMIGRERSLEKALAAVRDDYDFICIDTPPSLGLLTVNALTASDKVIVPVQAEYLSMRGLVQLQNTLEMIRENLNPGVEIEGILPTMLDSRTVHAKEAVEILEENFGELVFKSRIRKAIKFAEAPVRGSSVLKYDPKGNAAQYYRELAQEVLTNGASE
jgi:chromosome partitioning protein